LNKYKYLLTRKKKNHHNKNPGNSKSPCIKSEINTYIKFSKQHNKPEDTFVKFGERTDLVQI